MSDKFIVLAALDLNPGSTAVLERSLELMAAHPRAELHVVNVAEPQLPAGFYPAVYLPEANLPNAGPTERFCREFLAERSRRTPGGSLPHIQVHGVVGLPADEIVWLAAYLNADVIVMATRGRRGVKRLLLGSVAEKVVRLAGCPVFIAREKEHSPEWRVPEIEPLCPDCASKRASSKGAELWCARHSEHHVRGHVLHYAASGDEAPHAWSSSTGT